MDKDALIRSTSVYLTNRTISMLPKLLCESICSLKSGVERLTFSLFVKLNSEGEIISDEKPVLCKSVVKSCAKLSYEVV